MSETDLSPAQKLERVRETLVAIHERADDPRAAEEAGKCVALLDSMVAREAWPGGISSDAWTTAPTFTIEGEIPALLLTNREENHG